MSKKIENVDTVVNETPVTPAEEQTPVVKYGVVNLPKEFKALNVREEPDIKAKILCTVDNKAKLEIEQIKVAPKWFKVKTKDGVRGYCLKKFIVLK